ncbi:Beta-lactamase [Carpediemonas membranifera]|uniref:Beta-lactamase n=1 Tax=Carpediemonas membranifera TaxID=201153 RepID=A0A8J6E5T6_9EUKA|nr:Beta-lactamase [Carpediemonas membranifera]|eukprot:KAG9396277.1 Beta-lactamase [Carpediemonas membranifera]
MLKTLLCVLILVALAFCRVELSVDAVSAWAESWLASQTENDHDHVWSGGVLTIVQDTTILYSSGFGSAYQKTEGGSKVEVPFTTDTIFPCASISKIVTATMFLQCVQDNLVDLDSRVLDVVPSMSSSLFYRYGGICQYIPSFCSHKRQELEVWQLMTHTAGIDESVLSLFIHDESEKVKLGNFITHWFPPIIRKPGETVSYSNHGVALLGYIVEKLRDGDFESLAKTKIFEPLGMTSSSFNYWELDETRISKAQYQPSFGYQSDYHPAWNLAPAGNLYSNANDLLKFLLAHMYNGTNPTTGTTIISSNLAERMHRPLWKAANVSYVPGVDLQFYEVKSNWNDWTVHDGDFPGSHSRFAFNVQNNVGFILNTNGASILRTAFIQDFSSYFLNENVPDPVVDREKLSSSSPFGWFSVASVRNCRISHYDFLAPILKFSSMSFLHTKDGNLMLKSGPLIQSNLDPIVWSNQTPQPDETTFTFIDMDSGYISFSIASLELVSLAANPLLGIGCCCSVFAVACLEAPFNAVLALFAYRKDRRPRSLRSLLDGKQATKGIFGNSHVMMCSSQPMDRFDEDHADLEDPIDDDQHATLLNPDSDDWPVGARDHRPNDDLGDDLSEFHQPARADGEELKPKPSTGPERPVSPVHWSLVVHWLSVSTQFILVGSVIVGFVLYLVGVNSVDSTVPELSVLQFEVPLTIKCALMMPFAGFIVVLLGCTCTLISTLVGKVVIAWVVPMGVFSLTYFALVALLMANSLVGPQYPKY